MVPEFLIAFDPFHDEKHWHVINLPAEIEGCRSWQSYMDKWCLGVCRGRLRISRLFKFGKTSFKLKVWELSDYKTASPWLLVHKTSIDGKKIMNMNVLAFHPNNYDIVFLLCDHYQVKKYNMLNNEFEHVGEFQGGKSEIPDDLSFFFLWPTPIPAVQ